MIWARYGDSARHYFRFDSSNEPSVSGSLGPFRYRYIYRY